MEKDKYSLLDDVSGRLESHSVYIHNLFEQISQKELEYSQLGFFVSQYIYLWRAIDAIYKDYFEKLKLLPVNYSTLQLGNCLCDENSLIGLLRTYDIPGTQISQATLDQVEIIRDICLSVDSETKKKCFSDASSLTSVIIANEKFNLWLFTRTDFHYLFLHKKDMAVFKKTAQQRIKNLSKLLEIILQIDTKEDGDGNKNELSDSFFSTKVVLDSLNLFLNSIWYEFNLEGEKHHPKVGKRLKPQAIFDIHQIPDWGFAK